MVQRLVTRRRLVLLAPALALALSLKPTPADAVGNIFDVPDPYPIIQAAIDAAQDGDIVLVVLGSDCQPSYGG